MTRAVITFAYGINGIPAIRPQTRAVALCSLFSVLAMQADHA